MEGIAYAALISAGIFLGAVVSSLAGFAFSAVAGAVLLHLMPPIEAVPLMMVCSILVQIGCQTALRRSLQWRRTLVLVCGGLVGIVPAVHLLQRADTSLFRMGFGALILTYSLYMLLRSAAAPRPRSPGLIGNGVVGFGGGLIGGLTAMPGALPTIWCDLHGVSRTEQRSLVQPFIIVMQIAALTLMLPHIDWSSGILSDLALGLPALVAGTAVGVLLFGRLNEVVFRRVVLAALFISGLMLVV